MLRPLLLLLAAGPLLLPGAPAPDVWESPAPPLIAAVEGAPGLAAAAQRVEAARARMGAAGRLPDPEVEGMGSRMSGPMGESSTMWELSVRQPLPKRGERAADRERAQAALAMAQAEYAMMAGELAADTAMAVAEAEGAEARVQLLQAQIDRLAAVLRTLDTQLAAGTTSRMADRLTVQSRVASMQLMAAEALRMAEDARFDALGRLGLPADAPLPAYAAPEPADVSVERAAGYYLATARAAEAEAMVRMARASANPMTAIGLRFERASRAMGDEDTIGVAFMSELPWRARRYARAEARAAAAERDAARTDITGLRYRINAALTRVERAERLAATARRLSDETLSRLDAEYDAMIRSASVSGSSGTGMMSSTVLQTVEVLEKVTDTELQAIDAQTAARAARAALWPYAADRFLPSEPTALP